MDFVDTPEGKEALAAWLNGASEVMTQMSEVFMSLHADDAEFSSDVLAELAQAASEMIKIFCTDMRAARAIVNK